MSGDLKMAARTYLLARKAHQDALAAVLVAAREFHEAESAYCGVVENTGDEDSGTAFVCDGQVLLLGEEYWNSGAGNRVRVERLVTEADHG